MNSYESVWEDDETNRKIEVVVDYSLIGEVVQVHGITPKKVTFHEAETNSVIRAIGVWTKKGRDVVVRQMSAKGAVEQLQQEIAESQLATA